MMLASALLLAGAAGAMRFRQGLAVAAGLDPRSHMYVHLLGSVARVRLNLRRSSSLGCCGWFWRVSQDLCEAAWF